MGDSRLKRIMITFDIVVRWISIVFAWISGLVLLTLALMITTDVSLRFVFNDPLPAAPETSVLLLPWIVFPAFICALISGAHVRVSLVTDRLSPRVQSRFALFTDLGGLILFSVITYWGYVHFQESFVVREVMLAAIPLPWWAGKLALPIGALVMTLGYLNRLLQRLGRLADDRLEEENELSSASLRNWNNGIVE
jgi:TRAP-type C4-dicarboxylate transport system permease small subunit